MNLLTGHGILRQSLPFSFNMLPLGNLPRNGRKKFAENCQDAAQAGID